MPSPWEVLPYMPSLWEILSTEELKQRLRLIARQARSDEEFRDRVISDLRYPYSREGIKVRSDRTEVVFAELSHPQGPVSI